MMTTRMSTKSRTRIFGTDRMQYSVNKAHRRVGLFSAVRPGGALSWICEYARAAGNGLHENQSV